MKQIQKLTLTALMAAVCYVSFAVIKITIPTPAGYTSFHLGNAACVLSALLLGGPAGGLAGAIGMAIGDVLDPVYVIVAPKTIILKYIMGFIAGTLAHKVFKIDEKEGKQLVKYVVLSVGIAMLVNVILEPLFSYFYYGIILNNAEKAKGYLVITKYITALFNGIFATIVAPPLYLLIGKRKIK